MEDCSWSLYLCEDSHALEISLLLSKQLPENWETVYQSCQLARWALPERLVNVRYVHFLYDIFFQNPFWC